MYREANIKILLFYYYYYKQLENTKIGLFECVNQTSKNKKIYKHLTIVEKESIRSIKKTVEVMKQNTKQVFLIDCKFRIYIIKLVIGLQITITFNIIQKKMY